MGLNDTVSADRVHIAFFGKRNAGKSSVMNAVTSQSISTVSPVAGTTTDPVYKAMELLPLGPVMMIDTAGMDDIGELGTLRVKKTRQVLNKTDVAVLVVEGELSEQDREWISLFKQKEIPYLIVSNKSDLLEKPSLQPGELSVSALTGEGIHELKEAIAKLASNEDPKPSLLDDLVSEQDLVILVTPIDSAAPKGRLILPQQRTLRALLDNNTIAMVVKETQLEETFTRLKTPPKLVITDSQVFQKVAKITPDKVLLTSFSILFARQKGDLELTVKGVQALDSIQDGDKILISEGCTHHRQCDDIGTKKLPQWIREYTGKEPEFVFTSGTEFPQELSDFKLIIHCGGCMLPAREMKYRQASAKEDHIPITNYGITIAYLKGILQRCLQPFPEFSNHLNH